MAVLPNPDIHSPPLHPASNVASDSTGPASLPGPVDINVWAASALQSLGASPLAVGAGDSSLSIPIDDRDDRPQTKTVSLKLPHRPAHACALDALAAEPAPLKRHDSFKTREAFLKGREGSRRRRRWENDHLVGVPNAQPPSPIDHVLRPTYPVHNNFPYHIAALWDREGPAAPVDAAAASSSAPAAGSVSLRQRAEDAASRRAAARKRGERERGCARGGGPGEVPYELRDAIKRSSTVWGWVRTLEDGVRRFLVGHVEGWEHVGAADGRDSDITEGVVEEDDDDDETVVITGQHGPAEPDGELVFDHSGDSEIGSFKRWLTHAIAAYYGLASHSVNLGIAPHSRRVVCVTGSSRGPPRSPSGKRLSTGSTDAVLPRPISEVCGGRRV